MIKRVRVKSSSDRYFDRCWEIYVDSFPAVERRSLEYQRETMCREEYHFDAVIDREQFVGILGWWDLPDVRYIEHLATSPSIRNGGYGAKILHSFSLESTKPIILEVEHPEDEITRRRIGFYERMGFVLNNQEYSHPSYDPTSRSYVSLRIMTHPEAITDEWLRNFNESYFPMIHFAHYQ